jgi:hypothetical protein
MYHARAWYTTNRRLQNMDNLEVPEDAKKVSELKYASGRSKIKYRIACGAAISLCIDKNGTCTDTVLEDCDEVRCEMESEDGIWESCPFGH